MSPCRVKQQEKILKTGMIMIMHVVTALDVVVALLCFRYGRFKKLWCKSLSL